MQAQVNLLVPEAVAEGALRGFLALHKPDYSVVHEVDLHGDRLPVVHRSSSLARTALLPHVAAVGVVGHATGGLVGELLAESLAGGDSDHDVAIVGLLLPHLELVGLALRERNVPDEAVPQTVAVFFYYDYALVATVHAEAVPVRVIKEVIKLEQAELLVELF